MGDIPVIARQSEKVSDMLHVRSLLPRRRPVCRPRRQTGVSRSTKPTSSPGSVASAEATGAIWVGQRAAIARSAT